MAGLLKLVRRKKEKNGGEPKEDHGGPSVVAETIEKIALEVDYHGLADLYEASSWYARLFWSVIVIGALCAVIHDCYNIIMLFASNPSATKISEFQVKNLPLPNVTVCHMGAFNQTELRNRLTAAGEPDLQKQNDFIRYMMIMAYQTPPGNKTLSPNVTLPAKQLWDSMGLQEINETMDFLRETAYQCEYFLSDCEFAEEPFDCCAYDIFVYTDLGGCYTIRPSGKDGPVFQTGRTSLSGISVTTTMDVTEIAILEEWKSVGLRLQFGDYVSPFDFSSMLHLPPGMLALVRLSPVQYRLDHSVTDCFLTEPKLTYHDGYGTGLCKHDCVLKYTVKTCGCMPYGYSTKHAEQHRICNIEETRTCVLGQVWNTENGTDPEEIQECKRKNCLRMCAYWIHEPYLMLSQLKADSSALPNKRTNVLNVYFGYMRYTQTEAAQLMTFDTFVSNLGGAIGLWTGMSLISIIQMLVYGWEGFWRMVERRRAEKMIKTMLAQHPAQGNAGVQEKPIRIQGNLFVKPKVQFGSPQPSDHKTPHNKRIQNMAMSTSHDIAKQNEMGFGAKLKSIFRRKGAVQPSPHTDMYGRPEDSPPDPEPRPTSADNQSQATNRNQSLGTLFEPPPATVDSVGSGAPSVWTTLDEHEKGKRKKMLEGPEDNGSWTTAETTTTTAGSTRGTPTGPGGQGGYGGMGRQRATRQNNGRRHSRGNGPSRMYDETTERRPIRKRTQSEHKNKRHPLSRPRY